MTEEQALLIQAQKMSVHVSPTQVSRMLAYLEMLKKWNKVHNLTAIRDQNKMLTHHLLDSLSVVPWLSAKRLLDVGSGGGLPGIPLAIAQPAMHVTLIDSNHKKTSFLRQAVIELKLNNVEVVNGRVEQWGGEDNNYDGIIARAFAEVTQLIAQTRSLLTEEGYWYVMKGVYPTSELNTLPHDVQLVAAHSLHVPELMAERNLLIFSPL